jgi:FG-GAP-like repeat
MNNNVFVSGASGPTLPGSWSLAGVADFNRDGKTDYLLFNASTHQSAIWYLSGVTHIGSAFGPTLPSPWALTGTADFNRDGSPDYVLYNPSTGQTALWYLNNNVSIGGAFGPPLPAGWNPVAPQEPVEILSSAGGLSFPGSVTSIASSIPGNFRISTFPQSGMTACGPRPI